MSISIKKQCRRCLFYNQELGKNLRDVKKNAQCRRYPPKSSGVSGWAVVNESDWCGEWVSKSKHEGE